VTAAATASRAGVRAPFPAPPEEGSAIEIAPGVLWMRLPLPMALDHVNVYALADADGWTLVDTGMDTPRARAAWERLLAGPLAGRAVARVLVTHHHPDHMGLAGWFMARFGAELLMPRTAWLTARMLQLDVQARPLPEALAFWRAAGMPAAELARRAEERPFNFSDCTMPLPPGFTRLEEGATLELAGRRWAVRFGQGHAPDHATLWSADGDLVIAGDQALPSISPNIGVHATEPGADPLDEWLRSCRRLRRHARAGQLVLCGHNLPFTGLPQRLRQLERHHHAALRGLEAYLSAPRRAAECFVPLFRREIRGGEYGLALAEAVAHLNRLERSGRAKRETAPDGAWLWRRVLAGEGGRAPGPE